MNDEMLTHHALELKKMFGDQLPNPHQNPLQFSYFVKLYWFYLKRNETNGALVPSE